MRVFLAIYRIKEQKALKKAFMARENKVNLERNKVFHFKDSMVMYGIYYSDTLQKLINEVHKMQKKLGMKKIFVGKVNNWYQWYLSKNRTENYAINLLLYITTLREN